MSKVSAFYVPSYIRHHPFSTMALANIIGDTCYLGYAFASDGFVSLPKLIGALFTMAAHILLLAYGDVQVARIVAEQGSLSRVIVRLRSISQALTKFLPQFIRANVCAKPVGVTFAMLSINGIALVIDAFLNRYYGHGLTMIIQGFMGVLIAIGTGAFAAADFVNTQRLANLFTGIAPLVLLGASLVNIALASLTFNLFIGISVVVFLISNFAAFYTRIDKKRSFAVGI